MPRITKEMVVLDGIVKHFIEDRREPGWVEEPDWKFGPRSVIDHSQVAGTVISHPEGGRYLVNVVEIKERP